MVSGNFSGSAAESNEISGTGDWAMTGIPAPSIAASKSCRERLMTSLLIGRLSGDRGLCGCLRLQSDFLHSPGLDFRNDDLVRISAVQHVHDLEPTGDLAGMAELPDDRPVQFHLVDLARNVPRPRRVAVGVGIGGEEVL